MMTVCINPGSGPCAHATLEHAEENIRHFVTDLGRKHVKVVRLPEEDGDDGRFSFLLWEGTRCHQVDMPGLPLDRVRYVDSERQNIFDFPRLYVDGSSWIWCIALSVLSDEKWKD